MRFRFLAFLPLVAIAHAQTPAIDTYPIFENDKIGNAELAARRVKLVGTMPAGSVAVLFTNPERNRNNDVDFRFRGDSNFLYLTGVEEPDAALLLTPDGVTIDGKRVNEVLFVNDRNPGAETWTGYRMGPERASSVTGIALSVSNRRMAEVLKLVDSAKPMRSFVPEGPTGSLAQMITAFQTWGKGREAVSGLGGTLGKMRAIKSADELRLMQRAVDSSVVGHREAIKSCLPGMREFELQALVEYCFARNGCESVAYGSIVGSGPNSCILHYETDRRQAGPNDVICMDVAGEYHGYAADVTRSFPVNGKFSKEQRAIYDIVLAAQDAGIAQCRSGKAFGETHKAARQVLLDGLTKLGIVKDPKDLGRYFMHGTSHTVGLDVHDTQVTTLEPNVVLTVEPGIYIKAGSPCDPKWWNIGIRIEDDILVTTGDPIIMSAGAPRRAEDIEALMREKGIGNLPAGRLPARG